MQVNEVLWMAVVLEDWLSGHYVPDEILHLKYHLNHICKI